MANYIKTGTTSQTVTTKGSFKVGVGGSNTVAIPSDYTKLLLVP